MPSHHNMGLKMTPSSMSQWMPSESPCQLKSSQLSQQSSYQWPTPSDLTECVTDHGKAHFCDPASDPIYPSSASRGLVTKANTAALYTIIGVTQVAMSTSEQGVLTPTHRPRPRPQY